MICEASTLYPIKASGVEKIGGKWFPIATGICGQHYVHKYGFYYENIAKENAGRCLDAGRVSAVFWK